MISYDDINIVYEMSFISKRAKHIIYYRKVIIRGKVFVLRRSQIV